MQAKRTIETKVFNSFYVKNLKKYLELLLSSYCPFATACIMKNFQATWTEEPFFHVLLTILEQSLSLAMIGNQSVIEVSPSLYFFSTFQSS